MCTTVLAVRKVGHLNIKTKMFGFEVCLNVKRFCFHVKAAYLSYGEYVYPCFNKKGFPVKSI